MIDSIEINSDISLKNIEKKFIDSTDCLNINYFCSDKIISEKGNRYIFVIKLNDTIPARKYARILWKWIKDCYEPHLTGKIIFEHFRDENVDLCDVFDKALSKGTIENFDEIYFVKKITKYIENENVLSIDGFLRFRLHEYRQAIYDKIYEIIEELYFQQEYDQFVDLLSEYVATKVPMFDLIHITQQSDGKYELFNLQRDKIEFNLIKTVDSDQIENFMTMDDMLLSILIETAPRRIIWHIKSGMPENDLLNTIKSVFGKRFSICNNCDLYK